MAAQSSRSLTLLLPTCPGGLPRKVAGGREGARVSSPTVYPSQMSGRQSRISLKTELLSLFYTAAVSRINLELKFL